MRANGQYQMSFFFSADTIRRIEFLTGLISDHKGHQVAHSEILTYLVREYCRKVQTPKRKQPTYEVDEVKAIEGLTAGVRIGVGQ